MVQATVTSPQLRRVSTTKALAAAGDYAADDVLSENASTGTAWTFADVVEQNGKSGTIIMAQAIFETTALTPNLSLFLFTATPTSQLNDNAANTALLHADLANYVGRIDFPAMTDIGTGDSEATAVAGSVQEADAAGGTPSTNVPMPFICAAADNDLYGVVATNDAITGESAGDDLTIVLTIKV